LLKIRFKENMYIDGMGYEKGEEVKMAKWLAQAFIGMGVAEIATRPTPQKPAEEKPAEKKPPAKKQKKKAK
jgi:hypothetical protein